MLVTENEGEFEMFKQLLNECLGNKSDGQKMYEADVAATPLYHDGTARPTWYQLNGFTQDVWHRHARKAA